MLNGVLTCWRWLALPGEHFAAANDLDQSAGRQFQQISEMIRRNEYLKRYAKAYKNQLIFEPTGSTITALSVDACGNAGANHATASHTESWGIVYEGGIRAYEELSLPPDLFHGLPGLRICDSYAGFESESVTWHAIVDRGIKGKRIDDDWPIFQDGGLILFHIDGEEAQRRCYRGRPEQAAVYYSEQRRELRPGTFQRLHENQRATGEEAFIPMDVWDSCVDYEHRPIPGDMDLSICVGVDASVKHDSASVVAASYDHEQSRVILVRHRVWQPSAREPLDIDGTIGEFLRELNRVFNVQLIRFDPFQMHDLSKRLQSEGLPMEEYPQSVPNLTQMGTNLYELLQSKNIILYPDAGMRTAASHAIALQTSRGWRISKEKAAHKIDCIVALAMASLAAVEQPMTWWIS